MVLAHDYIVVWTLLKKEFRVIFQNVTTLEDKQSETCIDGNSENLTQTTINSLD